MASQTTTLECGDRVQVCDDTLQAFYGTFGTVLQIRRCPRQGHTTRIDVQMDDVPPNEGYASFYPHELSALQVAERQSEGTR